MPVRGSDGVVAGLAGADADRLLDRQDEDLAVADLFGARGRNNGIDGGLDQIIGQYHFDFHLGQEIHHIFRAAVQFGMALLPSEPLDLGDRKALDADFLKGLFHIVQFERLDDGFDFLHRLILLSRLACALIGGFDQAGKAGWRGSGRGNGPAEVFALFLRKLIMIQATLMQSGTEILTTAQMRAIESAAMAGGGVTGLALMERAGAAVAGHIRLRWPKPGRATVLCGPGNNGGDGYVVARLLAQARWQVQVLGLGNTSGPDAAEMKRRWQRIGPILPLTAYELRLRKADSEICVDAIFGTGLTRPPKGEIAEILRYLGGWGGDGHDFRERLVAVDCPSGLCLDSGVFLGAPRRAGAYDLRARLTVAFDSPKPGHLLERGPDCCGELVVADIGLHDWRVRQPDGAKAMRRVRLTAIWPEFEIPDERSDAEDRRRLATWLTRRDLSDGHKFNHGHALIIAGGFGRGGAARLSARAALRTGAGLVTICPPQSAIIEHSGPPDALMRRGIDDAQALRAVLQDPRIAALCLGPGCGGERAAELLPEVLAAARPCVLDADALTALARRGFVGVHDKCVLTPHAGEFARLFPDLAERLAAAPAIGPAYSRLDAACEAAARSDTVVLLKGPDTVIAAPDGRARIHSAFDVPWLATAGAGDVLAGLITGLLARGLPGLDAASLAALLHAKAARRFGPGLIADDLPEQIPGVFRDMDR